VTLKHATASTYVFGRLPGGWRIGLIAHPLFGLLTLPGGHVEPDESPPQAALREVAEESGLAVTLVRAQAAPLPDGLSAVRELVEQPWWILEQPVPTGDNHLAGPHAHVDYQYVALAVSPEPVSEPAHPFSWHDAADLPRLELFPDTRLLATALFARIEGLAQEMTRR
jgi:8-oxo-dGTP pyrophosphatase MutT (NUDIX family)